MKLEKIIQNLYEMIQNMSNVETKNVCKWIISHYHFNNGFYKLAEEELKSLLIDITNKENSLYSKNDIYDSQLTFMIIFKKEINLFITLF